MSLSKVWVYAEADGDKVTTITLELLTKAREIGDTVEAVFGGDGDAVAATLGAHGAVQGATRPAISAGACPASRSHRRWPTRSTAATRPISSCSARRTTVATSRPVCR